MKKNVLNEEISRIKNMMGKINESEFNMVPQEEEVSMEEARYDDDDDEEEEEVKGKKGNKKAIQGNAKDGFKAAGGENPGECKQN